MTLRVVGAGVGRTGTHSLKVALEQLLGGRCHHMLEVFDHPEEVPIWVDAIEGRPVDWARLMEPYTAQVDWPGASFWPELRAANPDALVLLSVRQDPGRWYKSASDTIFGGLRGLGPSSDELPPWMNSMRKLLADRFSDQLDDEAAMIEAYERHNAAVRDQVPADQLLEWTPSDGWEPICARLGLPVPDRPFPVTNTTEEFRARFGSPPSSAS
jgi:hypothetical protein